MRKQRRHPRILPAHRRRHIGTRELLEVVLVNERIDVVLAGEARPRHRQIRPRRNEPGAGRQRLAGHPQRVDQLNGEIAARAVAGDHDVRRRNAQLPQITPCRERVVERRRKRMLRRQPIADRERAHPRRPPRLRHHAAMARNRARAIAPAMEINEHPRRIAARHARPFPRHPVEIDRLELHIGRNRIDRAHLIKPRAAFGPPDGPRLASEERTDGIDFGLGHGTSPLKQPAGAGRAARQSSSTSINAVMTLTAMAATTTLSCPGRVQRSANKDSSS